MKKLGLILGLALVSLVMNAQSEISGTVTYYFNKNDGFKPDVGAKVFLVDSIGYNNIENSKELEQFSFGNTNSNDWYVFTGFTLTYTFGQRPCYCNF